MGKRLDRAVGFIVGIALFGLGFWLLQPEVVAQTDLNKALAAVMTALGIGVVAAAALPNAIEVNGEKFKPLGLNVKATGGAAVFVITLAFLYSMKEEPVREAPAPAPTEDRGSPKTPTSTGTASAPPQQAGSTTPAPPPAEQAVRYYRAATWCSDCCPQGPDFCQQVGFGEGSSAREARQMAIEQCRARGGNPVACEGNVELYSEDAPY